MLVSRRSPLLGHKRGFCQPSIREGEKQRIKEKMQEMRRKAKEAKLNPQPRRPTDLGMLCYWWKLKGAGEISKETLLMLGRREEEKKRRRLLADLPVKRFSEVLEEHSMWPIKKRWVTNNVIDAHIGEWRWCKSILACTAT
jgi:hypothetical protein